MLLLNSFSVLLIVVVQTVYCYLPYNSRAAHIVPFSSHGFRPASKFNPVPVVPDDAEAMNADDEEIDYVQPPNTNVQFSDSLADNAGNLLTNDIGIGDDESIDILRKQIEKVKDEEEIAFKSSILAKMLKDMPDGPLPIVYVEDESKSETSAEAGSSAEKRSGRYYRRYPWKRQNSRNRTYDADQRYLCVPSRDDVFKLLVGLHENRNGNQHKTVNFCNRKRPAKAIFTNIRFLG